MNDFSCLRADESFFDALTTLEDSRPATGPGCTERACAEVHDFSHLASVASAESSASAAGETALNVAGIASRGGRR